MGGYRQLPITPFEPQQSNPLQMLAGIQQLKNAQQSNVALQQENQQRQMAIQDQQAMTAAMHEWDGKDLNALTPLMVKHGASANAVIGLKGKVLEQQEKYSTIAKNDAETGAKNLETMKAKNDAIVGGINALKDVPDEQLAQSLTSTVQDLTTKGLLNPQEAQQGSQLAQSGDPAQMRKGLDLFAKLHMTASQQMEQAAKQAETFKNTQQGNEAQAQTALSQAKAAWAKAHGMPVGVPAADVQMADWLEKNPTTNGRPSGPSDYEVAMKKIVPAYNFNLQNAGTTGNATDVAKRFGMTPVSFDQAAEKYWTSGQLPPAGRGGPALALNKALMNRAADLHPEGSLAANSAEYKANSESLKKFQSQFDAVNAFESTAEKNIDRLLQTAKTIPDLGSKFLNVPVRMISGNMIGTEPMSRFKADLLTAQNEAAKVLNSANMTGVLSDSARHELQDLANGNLSYGSLKGAFEEIKNDMGNRKQSYIEQISDIKRRLGDTGGAPASQPAASSGMTRIKASDGSLHDIPTANLSKAKQIDPNLQVVK